MSLISLLPEKVGAVTVVHRGLRARGFEPERVGTALVLVLVASALILVLLFKLTPASVLHDPSLAEPDEIHSIFG